MNRIEREKKIVTKMISVYCRSHHTTARQPLCDCCRELIEYSTARLDHCPKGNDKSSCRKCQIHCYAPTYRSRIREVMRSVGPRMIFISPVAAIRHLCDEMT